MSDLFTFFVPPTTATQQSTGPIKSLCPMDDKLIIGKDNALLYINGNGPDNTGANNQYSDPIFITSGVGCSNQNSIVLIPNGLMFQSNKGIWLLGRDLGTQYIGKDVESLVNMNVVLSALTATAPLSRPLSAASGPLVPSALSAGPARHPSPCSKWTALSTCGNIN